MSASWDSNRKSLDFWIFSTLFYVWAHTRKNKQDCMCSTLCLRICEKVLEPAGVFWSSLLVSGLQAWFSQRWLNRNIVFFFLFWGVGGHADERLIDMVSGALWWIKLCVQTLWPWPVMAVAAFSASHCCGSFKKIWFSQLRNTRQPLSLRCLTSI